MRRIKFRGKRVDNSEWAYGYYLAAAGMPFISSLGVREPIFVIRKTVGQYTGKEDCDEVNIYEGDILEDGDGNRGTVYWNKDRAAFMIDFSYPHNNDTDLLADIDLYYFRVAGNIYESEVRP